MNVTYARRDEYGCDRVIDAPYIREPLTNDLPLVTVALKVGQIHFSYLSLISTLNNLHRRFFTMAQLKGVW